ncbi:hypothetical protein [Fredinandcohnia sp. 179-A 10B2 NHS]|uniref:hypothetical protein n=1 Tax=Fredinandcohnia sp. 179-A 10B2 NHS TaxID=3235176 RepID=UPI0039A3A6E0
MEGKSRMNNNQVNTTTKISSSTVEGYKVIEVNLKNQFENTYAVVTPVKLK